MDKLDIAQPMVSVAFSILPWFFPDCTWYCKTIITLLVLLASSTIYCVRLLRKIGEIEKEKSEIQIRHTALSVQFDEKTEREKRYRRAFQNLNLMLHLAGQNTKTAKFSDIYQAFVIAQNDINSGGMHDAENL